MNKKFEIKPENYEFPSKIGGFTIKTITWKDFPAKPPENTWFLAYTYWNTNYTCSTKNGRSSALATVSIGPKAWTRAQDDFKLLQHQTGHYWIACQCALQFQKRVNYTQKQPEDIPFLQWCQKVFKRTSSQFAVEQKRYDKETYHYCIQQQQQKWMKNMILKFNEYHKFFEQKRKQQEKNQQFKKINLKQNGPPIVNNNQRNHALRSLPGNQKSFNQNSTKTTLNPSLQNKNQLKKDPRQFSVRKTVTKFPPKSFAKNLTSFQQAKKTLLGNIEVLQKLK